VEHPEPSARRLFARPNDITRAVLGLG
jgi:hypothetical protein